MGELCCLPYDQPRGMSLRNSVWSSINCAAVEDSVSKHWRAFGAAGKTSCTVSDLLKCKSGVEAALPAKFSTYTSFVKDNIPALCDEIATAEPVYLRTFLAHCPHHVSVTTTCGIVPLVHHRWFCRSVVGYCHLLSEGTPSPGSDVPSELPDSGPPLPQEYIANLYFGWGYAVAGLVKAVTNRPIWDAVVGEVTSILPVVVCRTSCAIIPSNMSLPLQQTALLSRAVFLATCTWVYPRSCTRE